MEHINVEPIETFLQSVVCIDRLSLYRDVLDLLKTLRRGTMLDALNTILTNSDDLTPNQVVDAVHGAMLKHMRAIAADFGLVVNAGTLAFYVKLITALNLIDVWDENEYVLNVAKHALGEPHHKLHAILNIITPIDEEEYYQVVELAPISLIDKIIDIHTQRFEETLHEEEMGEMEVITEPTDVTLLRKVVKGNRSLIVSRMFEDGVVSNILPLEGVIEIANPYFNELGSVEPKLLARELSGVFLLAGLKGEELVESVRQNAHLLINDDVLLSRMNPTLTTAYTELVNE